MAAPPSTNSLHAFHMTRSPLVLAHNGHLADFGATHSSLWPLIKPDIARRMSALTDSAFFLSHVYNPAGPFSADAIFRAVAAALSVVYRVRVDHGIAR